VRLARVLISAGAAIGLVGDDLASIRVLDPRLGSVDDVVRGRVTFDRLSAAAERVETVALADVRLDAPVRQFNRDILCTGWNYVDHFYESMGKREGQDPDRMPAHPTFFTKGPDTVVGPYDPIAIDGSLSSKWDYEAEIALVIGKDGRSIDEQDAWEHVFGYLIANDVSQRDLQRAYGGQWLKGKSIDQTMPLGPWITTRDDVVDLDSTPIICELNGKLMQSATVKDMAFTIPRLIAELSTGMTLRTGDVLLTGTPSGIGNAREPALFLTKGDVLITRGGMLGELRNTMTPTALG
jgi:2-keto-4-pentenoate hydratase/2-oxohepta-3-ene-1,7-dioic acid hydratase in catechol pathway